VTDPHKQLLLVTQRQGHYTLPNDLTFEGLIPAQGGEIVQIRFSRPGGILLDFPVSAKCLELLAQCLGSLHGTTVLDMPIALAELRNTSGFLGD
jgi:hypothetical protein